MADDPSVPALIESPQPLVEPEACLEPGYSGGIKRIFDTLSAVVFIEHRMGDVACDKQAYQVKMLPEGRESLRSCCRMRR
jgi:hypothetical protein